MTNQEVQTVNKSQDDDVLLDACIFNCTYAEQQVDSEVKDDKNVRGTSKSTKMWIKPKTHRSLLKKKNPQEINIEVGDSSSTDSDSINDNASLLDFDLSSSQH
mmetsp:Transcript_2830/g.4282  ORF Transcript_2830/g.4282 Transcript_2830/m.4282 type:complete len:103 (+) Transcript_2830:91-399(+)|eukprot:CAMPEP_0197244396 /NCGR_PEP_ID=MMETSP1429-20130617/9530_1 /TAXON_ID=49237 /ORGANISM="Chaetoceros  sp., Strain UNC1202" /LENGTH=102 /DNA_ID=CAMNT_0042704747 /DNA_START=80 /DNA_END=388 /DNA_ORIENTATION=+